MHGVGWETARRVFAAAGLPEPIPVAEQQEPDPTFPTVSFPNPEEPGAMDLALELAAATRADLVIANDSGPMHIAAALGRPLVTLFGPTNPVRTGPYRRDDTILRLDLPCSPCYSRTCSHQSCLRWLTAEPVLAAAEAQLAAESVRTA
jgi:hypothetical protein